MTEIKRAISRCSFLFDWQKERLAGILDEVDGEGDGDENNGNGHISTDSVLPVIDHMLWRTVGTSLDLLPVGDRMIIERAVREVTY